MPDQSLFDKVDAQHAPAGGEFMAPSHTERHQPTEEEWAAMPFAEKARNVVQFAGKAIGGAFIGPEGTKAVDHPVATLATAATDLVAPGIARVVKGTGGAIYKGGVALLPKGLKQEFPTLADAGYREGVALTKRGAAKAAAGVRASADRADELVAARAAERPRVAGLLPEGKVAVPLGEAPTPVGGRPATQPARFAERVPESHIRARQGMSPDDPVVTYYDGMPATGSAEAVADTVAGPGVVLRPMNAPAVPGKVPGMVSLKEALAHVPATAREIGASALGSNDPGLTQTRRLVQLTRSGRQWPVSLVEAQSLKRAEQTVAHNAYRALDKGLKTSVPTRARFAKAVAQGTREAIEREVPAVAPVNARTQELMGLERAAEHSSNTGHILSRLGGTGIGLAMGSGAGLVPALASGAAGLMLTTPGGLTATGLAIKSLAPLASHSPAAARAILAAYLAGDE